MTDAPSPVRPAPPRRRPVMLAVAALAWLGWILLLAWIAYGG
ncbi:hypothetical protein [Posidoniimonas polymericola]|nr:hypothetical protein [Posidoniimonas polymericola]